MFVTIELAVALVQRGISTVRQIVTAVQAGRAAMRDADGQEIPPERVEAAIDAALAKAAQVATGAESRIESRHGADGTGQP